MYPLTPLLLFNPAKRDWLPLALTDDVWCFCLLSVSASLLAAATGSSATSNDSSALLGEGLRRLNARLETGSILSDETLGAVSCLALWSVRILSYGTARILPR